jgi:carboxylesterase type B
VNGINLPEFNEDAFLGIPFALQPVGNLRLRHPLPLNESWKGFRDAKFRSPSCPGYAGFDKDLELGEGKYQLSRK